MAKNKDSSYKLHKVHKVGLGLPLFNGVAGVRRPVFAFSHFYRKVGSTPLQQFDWKGWIESIAPIMVYKKEHAIPESDHNKELEQTKRIECLFLCVGAIYYHGAT